MATEAWSDQAIHVEVTSQETTGMERHRLVILAPMGTVAPRKQAVTDVTIRSVLQALGLPMETRTPVSRKRVGLHDMGPVASKYLSIISVTASDSLGCFSFTPC